MKRFLLILALLLVVPALAAQAQTTKNFNFRTSGAAYCDGSGEVCNDGANTTYVNQDAYPVTRNGITFGWTESASLDSRDRDNSIDARFAGMVQVGNASAISIFRVDVAVGDSIDIRLAAGDFSNEQGQTIVVKDNTTAFITCSVVNTLTDNYMDATCVARTRAAWPGSNVLVNHVMNSTTLFIEVGENNPTGNNSTTLAHLSLVITSGAGVSVRHRVISQ